MKFILYRHKKYLFLPFLFLFFGFAPSVDESDLSYFDYETYYSSEELILIHEEDDFLRWRGKLYGKDPTKNEEMEVPFFFFENRNTHNGPRPLIVLMPPIEGLDILSKDTANYLARRGFHVIVAMVNDHIGNLERPISDIDGFLIRTTVSVRMLLDFAHERKDIIDTNSIGAYGVSLGGIRASLAYGVDDRIKAAWTAVAGGGIAKILTESSQSIVREYREERIYREFLYDDEDFYREIKRLNKIDPLTYAHRRSRDDIYMITAQYDRAVPTATQNKLWREFDSPERSRIYGNHFVGIIAYRLFLGRIVRFFHDRLDVRHTTLGFDEKQLGIYHLDAYAAEEAFLKQYKEENPLPKKYQILDTIRIEFE